MINEFAESLCRELFYMTNINDDKINFYMDVMEIL